MASKILLLGDDDLVLRQAAAALDVPGWIVATERSADAALRRLLAGEAELAVIDADMTGGVGLRIANELQRRMGALPVVLLAASERQDLVNENGQAIAGKPIRAEALRMAISHALQPSLVALTPGPALTPTIQDGGKLQERPVHVLLGELARRGATGALALESEAFRARIHVEDGFLVAAASSESTSPAIRPVVIRACALSAGNWSFFAGERAPVPSGREPALGPAVEGVRRAYPIATIQAWLARHGGERITAHPELESMLAAAGIATGLPLALARARVDESLLQLPAAELALLFTLAGFALVRFAKAEAAPIHAPGNALPPGEVSRSAPPLSRAPPPKSAGRPIHPGERQAIVAEDARTADATWYEILGLDPAAEFAAIKTAYFTAAKRWHSDAFAGRDLDGLAPLVERIFARVAEAHRGLIDPAKRAEYDVFLERKAKGLPTDVASVLRAEESFLKAQALFRTRRFADAEALLRQAVELNPAEAEFWAYLGASVYHARGKPALVEAREALARARALIPRSLVTEYLEAQLEIGEGELDAAENRLRKILAEKPDHNEATRDLRALRERKERETASSRGFLGTLWKRK